MTNRLTLAAITVAASLPVAARAEVTTYGSLTFASEYVDRSESFSDDQPALQFYGEVESNGFYAGLFASNVDFGDDDNVEIDLYLGYRNTIGDLSYDIGYGRYYYDDSGDCCGEILLSLSYPVVEKLEVGGALEYDPEAETLASEISLDYGVTDTFSISGTYGRNEASDNNYWDVGFNYYLSDAWSVDVRYHDTSTGDPIFAAFLSYEFSFTGN